MKKTFLIGAICLAAMAMAGCQQNDARVVSKNLSTDSDNFKVARRVVFYNGITNDYMLTIEGYCSIGPSESSRGISVTCKTGPDAYKKHILGLSDNVTFFMEQLDSAKVSANFYKVTFKPSVIIPDLELR